MIGLNELKKKLSIFNMNLCIEANDLLTNVQTKLCKVEFQSENAGVFGVEVFKDNERIGEIGFGFRIRNTKFNKFRVSPTAKVFANDPYYGLIVDTFNKIIDSRVWTDLEV